MYLTWHPRLPPLYPQCTLHRAADIGLLPADMGFVSLVGVFFTSAFIGPMSLHFKKRTFPFHHVVIPFCFHFICFHSTETVLFQTFYYKCQNIQQETSTMELLPLSTDSSVDKIMTSLGSDNNQTIISDKKINCSTRYRLWQKPWKIQKQYI